MRYGILMKSLLTEKIFRLTDQIIRSGRPLSLTELSRLSGIERSACWRIVSDLARLGYLARTKHKKIEPGLGMVYWGQAACSQTFFNSRAMARIASLSGRLRVPSALAGLFQGQLVYLYRDAKTQQEFFRFPVRRSNLALTILVRKYGRAGALERLVQDAEAAGEPLSPDRYLPRIETLEREGFALETNAKGCNLAFPVERKSEVFGLAFFGLAQDDRRLPDLIVRGTLLKNMLESEE